MVYEPSLLAMAISARIVLGFCIEVKIGSVFIESYKIIAVRAALVT
jgi:hypothetical protein